MDVSRRGLAGVVAGAIAGGKEVANVLGSMGSDVAKGMGVNAVPYLSGPECAPSVDPLHNHPLADAFRRQWEYKRRILDQTGGVDPGIMAIKSYSPIYRTMLIAESNMNTHWMDVLKRHLGIAT